MTTNNRRSGMGLILIGLVGVIFFWITDHRVGLASQLAGAQSSIDQANQALAGTIIGIAGSCLVIGIGMWLMTRKSA